MPGNRVNGGKASKQNAARKTGCSDQRSVSLSVISASQVAHRHHPLEETEGRPQIDPALAETPSSRLPHKLRLEYLDGVRGLAALYVSLYHGLLTSTWTGIYHRLPPDLPIAVDRATRFLRFGHFAVGVFIVLSGYCLMLPVARSRDGHLPGGTAAFLWRRTRRILPPYYAALTLCLLLTLLPGMNRSTGTRWDEILPARESGAICSHLLLIQNWNPAWFFKIDAPAWSVAPEWQIYWLFAFVLLPLVRRLGSVVVTVLALGLGPAVHILFHGRYDFVGGGFVGLFVLGMLGASIGFSDAGWMKFVRHRMPWRELTIFLWVGAAVIAIRQGAEWMEDHSWLTDPLVGCATSCLLVFCTRANLDAKSTNPPFVLGVLQDKRLVRFGAFSYSYYLVHDPIMNLWHFTLRPFAFDYATSLGLMYTFGILFCITGAYFFHLVFERAFIPGRPDAASQTARVTLLSRSP